MASLDDGRVTFGDDRQTAADPEPTVRDPVCGMTVRTSDAAAAAEHGRNTYFFCSHRCKEQFVNDPVAFVP